MGRIVETHEQTVISEKAVAITCDFCNREALLSNGSSGAAWEREIQVPDYTNDVGYDYETIRQYTACYLMGNDGLCDLEVIVCPDCFRKIFAAQGGIDNPPKLSIVATRFNAAKVRDAITSLNMLAQRIEAEITAFENLVNQTRDFGISKLRNLTLKIHATLSDAESALLRTDSAAEE